jgi:hypothetical protein
MFKSFPVFFERWLIDSMLFFLHIWKVFRKENVLRRVVFVSGLTAG